MEGRALLDPCEDDAERALFVDVDAPLCDVRVATGIEEGLVARAKFTIDFFRLCVDPMLVKERKDALDEVLEWLNDGKVDKVRRAASRYSPHSHVAKAVLTRTNRPLPTPDEEIAWLTEDLVEEVDIALDLLHRSPSDVKLKAQVIELCHALGGLLHAPPRGSPNAVRTVLEQNELLDEIEPYADALRV